MDRYLDEQLARIATDHIDFYLIHGLNQATWENTARLGVLEFLDEAVADGNPVPCLLVPRRAAGL